MFKKVVVPLDGSKIAEIVLPYVYEIASRFSKEIILAAVSNTESQQKSDYVSYLQNIREQIVHAINDYDTENNVRVKTKILKGEPADEIIDISGDYDDTLIVMASHGHSGVAPPLLGGVATKILSNANGPVMLVRVPVTSSSDKGKLIKKILVPLDGSKLGEMILPYVSELAKSIDAKITLFNAMYPWGLGLGEVGPTHEEEEATRSSVISYLDSVGRKSIEKGITIESVAVTGYAGQEIIAYADGKNADLIAMTTHGRTGMLRFVFGSIAYKLLHHGDTPIMLLRSR